MNLETHIHWRRTGSHEHRVTVERRWTWPEDVRVLEFFWDSWMGPVEAYALLPTQRLQVEPHDRV